MLRVLALRNFLGKLSLVGNEHCLYGVLGDTEQVVSSLLTKLGLDLRHELIIGELAVIEGLVHLGPQLINPNWLRRSTTW